MMAKTHVKDASWWCKPESQDIVTPFAKNWIIKSFMMHVLKVVLECGGQLRMR